MVDYVRELAGVLHAEGDQAAFSRGAELLAKTEFDRAEAQRNHAEINSFMQLLRVRSEGDTGYESDAPSDGRDPIMPELRRKHILDAAIEICASAEFAERSDRAFANEPGWDAQGPIICRVTSQEVLDFISRQGLSLGVQQPLAVIATVLSNCEDFQRIARNTFTWQKSKETSGPTSPQGIAQSDDLPF